MPESLDPEAVEPVVGVQGAVGVGPPVALTAEFITHLQNLIEGNPEVGLRMAVARRVGLPFSEVAERWSMTDLAYELAWDRREVDNARHRCPGCGIDSRDQLTESGPRGRLGENPAWRLEVRQCPWCEERDELQAKLAKEQYKRPPPSVHYIPALPGEPFFDEGQIPRPVAPGEPQEPPGEPPASDLGG